MYNVDTKEIEAFLKSLHGDNELTDQTLINLIRCNFSSDGVLIKNYPSENSLGVVKNYLSDYFNYELVKFEYCTGVFKLGNRYYEVGFTPDYYTNLETLLYFQEVEPIEIKVIRYAPKQPKGD